MDLFLCNISVYGNCSNMKNSKSNASSNQIEKKVENNIMDNNRHAFIPEISDSLGLHRQKTSFLVVLLLLLVYQILRSPGFLDLLHQLAYQHSRSSCQICHQSVQSVIVPSLLILHHLKMFNSINKLIIKSVAQYAINNFLYILLKNMQMNAQKGEGGDCFQQALQK